MRVLCERCGALAEGRLAARPGGGAALVCGACGFELARTAAGEAAAAAELPAAPVGPRPTATAAEPAAANDDEAWARVLARWEDDGAHEGFLARFGDLAGLAEAGRRYREALAARPFDPVALRWREEVLRRAAAQGLMQLPRTVPPPVSPKALRWAVVGGMIGASVLAAAWMLWRLLGLSGRS